MNGGALIGSVVRAAALARGPVVRFSIGEADVVLWSRPGAFCDDEALQRIARDLRAVAQTAHDDEEIPAYGVLNGDREALRTRDVVLVYDRASQRPVAFNSLSVFNVAIGKRLVPIVYLGLTYVALDHQRGGMLNLAYGVPMITRLVRNGGRSFWLSTSTQVPSVVGIVADSFDDVYPHYAGGVRQSRMHLEIARSIMSEHRASFGVGEQAGFHEGMHIITTAYTPGSEALRKTYHEAPKYRVELANEFCRRWLDYERGDEILQIGRCSVRSVLRFTMKSWGGRRRHGNT